MLCVGSAERSVDVQGTFGYTKAVVFVHIINECEGLLPIYKDY